MTTGGTIYQGSENECHFPSPCAAPRWDLWGVINPGMPIQPGLSGGKKYDRTFDAMQMVDGTLYFVSRESFVPLSPGQLPGIRLEEVVRS